MYSDLLNSALIYFICACPIIVTIPINENGRDNVVEQKTEKISLRIPGSQPKHESVLCHGIPINNTKYIVGYEPQAAMPRVHHMILFACQKPGSFEPIWDCGEMEKANDIFEDSLIHHQSSGPCDNSENIVYAWAMDAPKLELPSGVGFQIGPKSGGNEYIVLQVHYKDVTDFLPPFNMKDNSGVDLIVTGTRQPKLAGVYFLGSNGMIPKYSTIYLEAACQYDDPIDISLFAFRTHTHKHGKVVSGYRIRNKVWTEIGRKNPQLPQMFYNTTTPNIDIQKDDIIAVRCTMVNTEDQNVNIGSTADDEMCNFYIMFYVADNAGSGKTSSTETNSADKEQRDGVDSGKKNKMAENPQMKFCYQAGWPLWSWTDNPFTSDAMETVPGDVSVVPGSKQVLEQSPTRKVLMVADKTAAGGREKAVSNDNANDDNYDDEAGEWINVKNDYPAERRESSVRAVRWGGDHSAGKEKGGKKEKEEGEEERERGKEGGGREEVKSGTHRDKISGKVIEMDSSSSNNNNNNNNNINSERDRELEDIDGIGIIYGLSDYDGDLKGINGTDDKVVELDDLNAIDLANALKEIDGNGGALERDQMLLDIPGKGKQWVDLDLI